LKSSFKVLAYLVLGKIEKKIIFNEKLCYRQIFEEFANPFYINLSLIVLVLKE